MKRKLNNAYVKIVSTLLLITLSACVFSACFLSKTFADTTAIWSYDGEDFKISFTTTGDKHDDPLGTAYFNGTEYSIRIIDYGDRIKIVTDNVSDNVTNPDDKPATDDENTANDTQTTLKYKTLWGCSYKENKNSLDIEIIFDYTGATGENSPVGKKFTVIRHDLY